MDDRTPESAVVLTAEETDQLKRLAALYTDAKALILYSEEFDPDSRSNLQTIKELRDAFDHTMRVVSFKFGTAPPEILNDPDYGRKNLQQAVSHVYRAAFDALDGTVITLREKITEILRGYSPDTLTKVVPEYWEQRRTIEVLTAQISTNRARKDVALDDPGVYESYLKNVEILRQFYELLLDRAHHLEEYEQEKRSREAKSHWVNWLFGIVGGVIAGILVYLFTK